MRKGLYQRARRNNYDVLKDGAEACDVTIRCYILGQVLDEVLDELEDNE